MSKFRFRTADTITAFIARYHEVEPVLGLRVDLPSTVSLAVHARNIGRDGRSMLVDLALQARPRLSATNWDELTALPLPELVQYVLVRHHGFAEAELGRIGVLVDAATHGDGAVAAAYREFAAHHRAHLTWEEQILFPALLDQAAGDIDIGNLSGISSLHGLYPGHPDDAVHARFPALVRDAPSTHPVWQILRSALAGFDRDLVLHNACEDEILLPASRFAAELCRG